MKDQEFAHRFADALFTAFGIDAHVQPIDAGLDRLTRLLDEQSPGRRDVAVGAGQPPPVGDEMEDQGSARESAPRS